MMTSHTNSPTAAASRRLGQRYVAIILALAGFLVANTLHALSHAIDLDLGGRASDPYTIGAVSLLAAAALVVRVRQRRTPTSRA